MIECCRRFICVFCLLIFPFILSAQNGGNDSLVSISYQKGALKDILKDISSQTGFHFVYNSNSVDDEVKLDVKIKNKNIEYVLLKISEILDFQYIILEKQIILKPRRSVVKTKEDNTSKLLVISGYIRDLKSQEALIGATISVEGKNIGTVTNDYGYYSLSLKRGDYTIVISYLGYKREYVKLALSGSIVVNKSLEYIETAHEAVSISGTGSSFNAKESLNKSGGSINVKSFSQYSGLVLGGDLVGILATDKGITRLSDGSAFYCVRGGGKDQNLVLIDEAPIYHPSHLFGFYSSVSSDAINAIDVYTFDFPIKYGGRLSSVTDIRTRDGILGKFQLKGELTPFTVSALVETPINKDEVTATVNFRKSILKLAQRNVEKSGDNSFYDVNAKVHFKISPKNRLYVSFYGSSDYYNGLNTSTDYAVTWYNIATTVRDYQVLGSKLFMNNSLYMGQYKYKTLTNVDKTDYWTTSIQNLSLKSDFVYNIDPKQSLRFGLEYSFHFFTPATLYTDRKKTDIGLLTGNADNEVIYVGCEKQLSDKLALKAGSRFNFWGNYGVARSYSYDKNKMSWDTISYPKGRFSTFFELEPRIAVVYKPISNVTMKLSGERNVQFLHTLSNSISPFTTLDLWIPSGKYFKPQSVNAVTFSFETLLSGFLFSFSSYYKYFYNLTEYIQHANMLINQRLENEFYLGKSNCYGFEAAAEKTSGRFLLKAFYAYSYSRRLTPELSSEKYISDYNIPHTIHLMTGYTFGKNLSVKADWSFNSGIPYTKPIGFFYYENYKIPFYGSRNNARLPDYHKMNVAVQYNIPVKKNKNFNHGVTVSVLNVYNRVNFVMVSYNKIKTPDGKYVIPSNYVKDNNFLATGLSLPGIMPMISYQFRVGG